MSKDKSIPSNIVLAKEKFKYDTIQDMVNDIALKVGMVVDINGYYKPDDGAIHKRVIADTDDGSGVQLKNGLWANIVHNGEVNVSWFGAKGDGVSDEIELFKKVFNYISENNVKLYLQKEKHYILNDVIKVLNFKTNLDIDGQNSILDFNATQKLGYNNRVGKFINISREIEDNNSYAKINNLICLGSRYEHTDSTTKENANSFGGISLSKFYNVEITNLKEDSISFSGGIGLYYYKFAKIENVELTNCGRKFIPTADSTSEYDAGGDAIYLGRFKENAVTIINNITASSWEGKYGRCGIVYEYSGDTQNHLCKVSNFTFKGYHRTIHQEDDGATKSTYINGKILDTTVGYFDFGNSKGSSAIFENIYFENGTLIRYYGGNGGLGFSKNGIVATFCNFINCNINYNFDTQESSMIKEFNNCTLNFNANLNQVAGKCIYNNCNINYNLTESISAQKNNANISIYNNCNITGKNFGLRYLYFTTNATLKMYNCTLNDCGMYLNSNRDVISEFVGCTFNLENGSGEAFFGYASYRNFKNCTFNNKTKTTLKIYGDGGMMTLEYSNCTFNDIRIDFINTSSSVKNRPVISNCIFNVAEDSILSEFIYLYNSYIFMTGCKFNQANGTTTYLTPNTTFIIIRDCVVYKQDKSVVILDSQATEPTKVLNTPVMMYAMEQESGTVKQDFLNYSLEKSQYDKQVKLNEQQKQESYQLALQESPNLTYEDFISQLPTTLESPQEPEIPETVKKFMEKYL